MASVYPSFQWAQPALRGRVDCNAGSDIWAGTPVRLASVGDWTVVMCASQNDKPLGIARDFAAAGNPVAVFDDFNIIRPPVGVGGSFPRQAYVGVISTTSSAHPISGIACTFPLLGQVTGTPSEPVGASLTPVWAVGTAWESAATNDQVAIRIEPRLLSGMVLS